MRSIYFPYPIYKSVFIVAGIFHISLLQAQTSAWCDVNPWPILAGCGSLGVGLQFTGDDVFCNGETVTILNTVPSDADSTLVCWGDGSFTAVAGTPMTFSHVYAFPPDTCPGECITFIIQLAVIKHCVPDKMSFKWIATPVQVCFPPIAQFAVPQAVCTDDLVSINNQSCENSINATYSWSMPGANPNTSTAENPVGVSYPTQGNYTISLTVSNAECGSDTYSLPISVGPPATAVADLPDTLCVNDTIMPVNSSLNAAGLTPYFWSFPTNPGSGAKIVPPSTAFDKEPKMTFTKPGTYVVRLAVTGCHSPVWTQTVVVIGPPVVALSGIPTDPLCGDTTFTPVLTLSGDPADAVHWSITGGTPAMFDGPAQSITFSGTGTKTILVSGENECGFNTVADTFAINPPASAAISISADTICAPGQTVVISNVMQNATGIAWTVTPPAGVTPPSSNAPEPVFSFSAENTYHIHADVLGCGNLEWDTTVVVRLSPVPVPGTVDDGCVPVTLDPNDVITLTGGTPDFVIWVFTGGDSLGFIGTNPGPVTFSGAGTKSISVTVGNDCDTASANVSFQIFDLTALGVDTVAPLCSSDPPIVLHGYPAGGKWVGPGISQDTILNPAAAPLNQTTVYTYQYGTGNCAVEVGLPVLVQGTDSVYAGPDLVACTNSPLLTLTGSPPNGSFSETNNYVTPGGVFNPSAVPANNYYIVYTYLDPTSQCPNYDTVSIAVSGIPSASLDSIGNWCAGIPLQLGPFAGGGGTGTSCAWNFGDAQTSNTCDAEHTWQIPGTYNLTLILENQADCRDTATGQIQIITAPVAQIAPAFTEGCGDTLSVLFSNLATWNDYTAWTWNYGDGSPVETGFDPVAHPFAQGETDTIYTIVQTSSNACGSATATAQVLVHPRPIVRFGASQSTICSSDSVSFNNYSTGQPDTFKWYVNGALISTDPQLPPQYFTTGTQDSLYIITLVAENACGTDTLRDSVLVKPNPVKAFFNLPKPAICQNSTLKLTDLSTNGLNVTWNFGDGNTATGDTVWHTFTTPGDFVIYEYVNNGCGYDTAFQSLTVWPAPTASFVHAPYVCRSDTIFFDNTSLGIAGAYWNFGDGTIDSTVLSPGHVYAQAGTYTVALTVFSETHLCPDTVYSSLTVRELPVPAVSLPGKEGCQPFLFTGQGTTPGASTYKWDFGDGSTGVGMSFSHLYYTDSVYTLGVTVTDNFNCSADTTIFPINVRPKPVAGFSVVQTNLCETPAQLIFQNNSTDADAYLWSFQNGQSSDQVNPAITVNNGGPFTVTLLATNQWMCRDTLTEALTIYAQPVAGFSLPDSVVCMDDWVYFDNNSLNVNHYSWDFGDGTTSAEFAPAHLYGQPGVYTVTLQVSADSVCFDSLRRVAYVRVLPSPTAGFTAEPVTDTTVVPNGIYRFFDTSSPDVVGWDWDFGDGQGFSAEQNPVYRFDTVGVKIVTLIVTNALNCPDTASLTLEPDFFGSLFIPNALTPDYGTDGERLFLPAGSNLAEYEISIFAPNGQCVFHSTLLDRGHPAESWDGTYNGVPLPQGVYFWKVRARFSNNRVWQGMVYKEGEQPVQEGKVWLGR